jgi:sugar lactone lactonase YvrE
VDSAGRLVFLTYLPGKPDSFAVDAEQRLFRRVAAAGEIATTPGAYKRARRR